MKNQLLILVLCFLFSCSQEIKKDNELKNKGEIEVENGMGQKIKISYLILYRESEDSSKRMSTEYLNKIVRQASISAKYKCKFKPTYEPLHVDIMLQKGFKCNVLNQDSITTAFEFRAKNAFGVPDNLNSYSKFSAGIEFETF